MLAMIKKNLWSAVCVLWAMALALFWFAMRVIWSGISKVVSEAVGENVPSTAMLNLPLYISILLWAIFVFSVVALIWLGHKKWSKITLTVLLGVFTVASAVVVVMGAVDYLYFILPKFFLSMAVGLCIAVLAWLVFCGSVAKGRCGT
ncbi:MAG: hypothetical protein J6W14_00710, partial [Clostridia bacterium]|nr:hypothetical protein [Clostridia bacterium]